MEVGKLDLTFKKKHVENPMVPYPHGLHGTPLGLLNQYKTVTCLPPDPWCIPHVLVTQVASTSHSKMALRITQAGSSILSFYSAFTVEVGPSSPVL